MATLLFAAAGSAIGSALLPAGVTLLGTTLTGAAIGSQVGALAGAFVDEALFGSSGQSRRLEGPRLGNLQVMSSNEGAPIPRIYGRARVGGQVIWATDFEEVVTTEAAGGGGGGGGGGGKGGSRSSGRAATTRTTYSYFANVAVALGEGELSGLGRVWADGRELDLTNVSYRFYPGSEAQDADSLIVAREGSESTPAYRGTAYVVFERLALEAFGNRLPQLSFEVFRAVDDLRQLIRGVVVIPGSGEFVYATQQITRDGDGGSRVAENVNTRAAATNWAASMEQLAVALPNARSASLVVSWFADDLRAGKCQIRPGVERSAKDTRPLMWSVAGETRAGAYVVSQNDGRPAYGGTPSDQTVVAAIQDLKARDIDVVLTPFILMDIAEGNALADPYSGAVGQPAYPWRGRITVDPAPGLAGTPDKTAAAATQLAALVGTAQVSDFTISGESVIYTGPAEWSWRRCVLHYAHLAKAAGGVDAFVIGSELGGLTRVRDSASHFPFVDALVQLAADVKAVLGSATKVTYGADWSEYFGHQPDDGTGDVYFHLDPLWASSDIDAIGIDLYWPLADWRRGSAHLDSAVTRSIYDLAYLKSNLTGGEGYDWYYASTADRDGQVRTAISDGQGKPWVFRFKDVRSWWQNQHYDRPGGIEAVSPTAWVPESKPIWLTEFGCPAVDKAANQPNVFHDPKSSESALPHYGEARRDDFMQRRYLQAIVEGFDPDHAGYVNGLNPVSTVYGGRMVDLDRLYVYAWDARPFPAFPLDAESWGDAGNWRFGHWLNGRFANMALDQTVAQILTDYGFGEFDSSGLDGSVPGYVIDRIMPAREALQPLELAYFFDAVESDGRIVMRPRGGGEAQADLAPDGLVEAKPASELLTMARGQETDLPAIAKVRYTAATGDYRGAVSEARKLSGESGRVARADLALMLEGEQAAALAESWLHEAWAARDTATFMLPPSKLALEPGDLLAADVGGRQRLFRIIEIGDHGARDIEARSIDPAVYAPGGGPQRGDYAPAQLVVGPAEAVFLDLPLLKGDEPERAGYVAISQTPWPGDVAIFSSPDDAGYVIAGTAYVPATIGTTVTALAPGPEGRFDRATTLRVTLSSGSLASVTRLKLFAGGNGAAVRNGAGAWEVLQFEQAELVDERTYDLSGLLRGQGGTEGAMAAGVVAAGAPFVVLDSALVRIDLSPDQVSLPLNWRHGPAGRDIGHSSYAETAHAFIGLGRRPLSAVHVRGARSSGDLEISWIRRTRRGGDNWDVDEVPLGEEGERYEVDILDGANVVRTLASTTPSVIYSSAEQTADFGSAQAAVVCHVYQLSQVWGRGEARHAVV